MKRPLTVFTVRFRIMKLSLNVSDFSFGSLNCLLEFGSFFFPARQLFEALYRTAVLYRVKAGSKRGIFLLECFNWIGGVITRQIAIHSLTEASPLLFKLFFTF